MRRIREPNGRLLTFSIHLRFQIFEANVIFIRLPINNKTTYQSQVSFCPHLCLIERFCFCSSEQYPSTTTDAGLHKLTTLQKDYIVKRNLLVFLGTKNHQNNEAKARQYSYKFCDTCKMSLACLIFHSQKLNANNN